MWYFVSDHPKQEDDNSGCTVGAFLNDTPEGEIGDTLVSMDTVAVSFFKLGSKTPLNN